MNYTPNTQRWQVGDIVIHDADAKNVKMLMRVTGYDARTGECLTEYLHPKYILGMDMQCSNDIRYLHDPAKFGVSVPGGKQ